MYCGHPKKILKSLDPIRKHGKAFNIVQCIEMGSTIQNQYNIIMAFIHVFISVNYVPPQW